MFRLTACLAWTLADVSARMLMKRGFRVFSTSSLSMPEPSWMHSRQARDAAALCSSPLPERHHGEGEEGGVRRVSFNGGRFKNNAVSYKFEGKTRSLLLMGKQALLKESEKYCMTRIQAIMRPLKEKQINSLNGQFKPCMSLAALPHLNSFRFYINALPRTTLISIQQVRQPDETPSEHDVTVASRRVPFLRQRSMLSVMVILLSEMNSYRMRVAMAVLRPSRAPCLVFALGSARGSIILEKPPTNLKRLSRRKA